MYEVCPCIWCGVKQECTDLENDTSYEGVHQEWGVWCANENCTAPPARSYRTQEEAIKAYNTAYNKALDMYEVPTILRRS